jgi:cell division septal protein FtsQ
MQKERDPFAYSKCQVRIPALDNKKARDEKRQRKKKQECREKRPCRGKRVVYLVFAASSASFAFLLLSRLPAWR